MRDLFGVLREQYDFILIDAPPILPLSDMNIFEKVVDGIMMVVRAERTSKDAVMRALNTLGREKVLGIVLNDVRYAPFSSYRYNRYNHKYKTGQQLTTAPEAQSKRPVPIRGAQNAACSFS
jgi:Mrp family chromosome partitioning ATPase